MRILVVDSAPPCNLLQGNSLIGWHLFSRLRHHHLTLVCPAPPDELDHHHGLLSRVFDEVHLVPRDGSVPTLVGLLEPTLARTGLPPSKRHAYAAVRAFQAQVAELVSFGRFDVVHTRQLATAAITSGVAHPCKVLELVDSETLQTARRWRISAPRTWLRALAARILEQRAIRHFTACTTVAAADAAVIRGLTPHVPVHVMPNGVDVAYFAPLGVPEKPGTIIFSGAMSFPPNVTAVLHFYNEVLPIIRRQMPDVRFLVVGRNPAQEITALEADPHVTITGFVADVRPWIAKACVSVCPMVMGSGIKNKVLEALAMARPVVTTALGAEALEVTDGRELRIADFPDAFASAVLDLLREPAARRRLGDAGRALVKQRYTWDACAASYDQLYTQLVAARAELLPRQHSVYGSSHAGSAGARAGSTSP